MIDRKVNPVVFGDGGNVEIELGVVAALSEVHDFGFNLLRECSGALGNQLIGHLRGAIVKTKIG